MGSPTGIRCPYVPHHLPCEISFFTELDIVDQRFQFSAKLRMDIATLLKPEPERNAFLIRLDRSAPRSQQTRVRLEGAFLLPSLLPLRSYLSQVLRVPFAKVWQEKGKSLSAYLTSKLSAAIGIGQNHYRYFRCGKQPQAGTHSTHPAIMDHKTITLDPVIYSPPKTVASLFAGFIIQALHLIQCLIRENSLLIGQVQLQMEHSEAQQIMRTTIDGGSSWMVKGVERIQLSIGSS